MSAHCRLVLFVGVIMTSTIAFYSCLSSFYQVLHIQDFDPLCPPILMAFFRLFATCSHKEWDHVADESDSHILRVLRRSFSAKRSSCLFSIWEVDCFSRFVEWDSRFMHFMLPSIICIILKVIFYHLILCEVPLCFLLLLFQNFLDPKRCCFTLKRDSDDHDCFLQSHIFTVIKTELCDVRAVQNSYRYHMIIHFSHADQCVLLWMNLT